MQPIERHLTQQAAHIPEEGVYLKSRHVHDFVGHTWVDKTGATKTFCIDGGLDYQRRVGDLDLIDAGRVVDWSIWSDDEFEVYRDHLLWGTYGPDGDQPLRWVPLKDCTLDHLKAIQRTQSHIVGTIAEKVVDWWVKEKEGL
jgi:hypothetical protein